MSERAAGLDLYRLLVALETALELPLGTITTGLDAELILDSLELYIVLEILHESGLAVPEEAIEQWWTFRHIIDDIVLAAGMQDESGIIGR